MAGSANKAGKNPAETEEKQVEILKIRVPSPIGDLGIELHDQVAVKLVIGPKGVEKRRFLPFSKHEPSDFLDELYGRFSEYFAGARPNPGLEFDLEPSGVTGFAKKVLKEAAKTPYGKTRTYRKIATAAGKPTAYRMVLAALLANPVPILLPCHRIVTNKSGIGSYIGGQDLKRWLLSMEKEGLKA